MKAFNNEQKTKDLFVNRMKEHARLDELIQGEMWENGRRKPISPKMLFKLSSIIKDHDYLIQLEKAFCKEAKKVIVPIPKKKKDREILFDLIYSLEEPRDNE